MSELQAQRNKLNEALSLMQQKEAAEAKALAERGAAIHHLKSETAGFKVRFEPCGFLGGFGGVFGGGRGGVSASAMSEIADTHWQWISRWCHGRQKQEPDLGEIDGDRARQRGIASPNPVPN